VGLGSQTKPRWTQQKRKEEANQQIRARTIHFIRQHTQGKKEISKSEHEQFTVSQQAFTASRKEEASKKRVESIHTGV